MRLNRSVPIRCDIAFILRFRVLLCQYHVHSYDTGGHVERSVAFICTKFISLHSAPVFRYELMWSITLNQQAANLHLQGSLVMKRIKRFMYCIPCTFENIETHCVHTFRFGGTGLLNIGDEQLSFQFSRLHMVSILTTVKMRQSRY